MTFIDRIICLCVRRVVIGGEKFSIEKCICVSMCQWRKKVSLYSSVYTGCSDDQRHCKFLQNPLIWNLLVILNA